MQRSTATYESTEFDSTGFYLPLSEEKPTEIIPSVLEVEHRLKDAENEPLFGTHLRELKNDIKKLLNR